MSEEVPSERPSDNLLVAATLATSYKAGNRALGATGFRPSRVRWMAVGSTPNGSLTAEEFLSTSRLRRSDAEFQDSVRSYFTDDAVVMASKAGGEQPPRGSTLSLPRGVPLSAELGDVFVRRRSAAHLTKDPIDLPHLATLLRSAAGITGRASAPLASGGAVPMNFRAVPSGGGLYPIELYFIASHVDGLDHGVYRYRPLGHELVREGDEAQATAAVAACTLTDEPTPAPDARDGAGLVVLVARPWRAMRKYGDRGLRFALHEAGGTSQHIHLAAVALGLGSRDLGGFVDEELNEVLRLDGRYAAAVHTIVVGRTG